MIPEIMRTYIRYSLENYINHIEQGVSASASRFSYQHEQYSYHQNKLSTTCSDYNTFKDMNLTLFLCDSNSTAIPIISNLYRNSKNMLSSEADGVSNFIFGNIDNHSIEILGDDELNTSLATALSQVIDFIMIMSTIYTRTNNILLIFRCFMFCRFFWLAPPQSY